MKQVNKQNNTTKGCFKIDVVKVLVSFSDTRKNEMTCTKLTEISLCLMTFMGIRYRAIVLGILDTVYY